MFNSNLIKTEWARKAPAPPGCHWIRGPLLEANVESAGRIEGSVTGMLFSSMSGGSSQERGRVDESRAVTRTRILLLFPLSLISVGQLGCSWTWVITSMCLRARA